MTAGDVVIADGVATITTPTGVIRLAASGDGLICGPCALARWLHVLNLTAVYSDRCVIDSVIARAAPLVRQFTASVRRHRRGHRRAPGRLPLLPPIDRWGLISAISAQRGHRDRRQPYALRHGSTARVHRPPGTRELLGH